MEIHLPQVSVTFLGTSAAWPTVGRNVASTAIKWGGEVFLFDCGEGTQRQIQRSGLSYMAISHVFLTHLHGDHHYGLPGLLKTMQLNERKDGLFILGPPGTRRLMGLYQEITGLGEEFPIRVKELADRESVSVGVGTIRARKLNHGAYNNGYAFEEPARPGRFDKPKALGLGVPEGPLFRRLQKGEEVRAADGRRVRPEDVLGAPRPGRKIVLTGDTAPCSELLELADAADLFIAEATYCNDMVDKATEFGHMTAAQAAEIARRARVQRLWLTHVSPRYVNGSQHLAEARPVFPATGVAEDLQTVDVPLRE